MIGRRRSSATWRNQATVWTTWTWLENQSRRCASYFDVHQAQSSIDTDIERTLRGCISQASLLVISPPKFHEICLRYNSQSKDALPALAPSRQALHSAGGRTRTTLQRSTRTSHHTPSVRHSGTDSLIGVFMAALGYSLATTSRRGPRPSQGENGTPMSTPRNSTQRP